MYNGGFGAYPQDDMGVNSYFGESDTNFFGDTSNDSFFGEGVGFTGFGNGDFFNESVGFSTDGSEVISENAGFSTYGMFCEGDNSVDSDKKGDYIDKHKGENSMEYSPDFKKALAGRSKEEKRTFDEMKKLQDRKFGTPTTAKEPISDETFNGVVDKHKEALDRHREGTSMQYGIAKKRGSRFDHKKSIENNKK